MSQMQGNIVIASGRVWLFIVGENCGQDIGFHLILSPWIKLIRFDNWKVGIIKAVYTILEKSESCKLGVSI